MAKAHSLKRENKPTLFSFDIETETKNIERWVYDNRAYSKRDLEIEFNTLIQLATDYINIIETKELTIDQLQNLTCAIQDGASGVWEKATSKIELLAHHFDNAKQKIVELIKKSDSKTAERLLNCISDAFSKEEQLDIFNFTIKHKSNKIRVKTASVIYDLKNVDFIDFLKNEIDVQTDKKVIDSLIFALDKITVQ